MMNSGEVEFSEKVIEESVNVITDSKFMGESFSERSKFLTILFEDDLISVANVMMHQPKLAVEGPSPFPYTDNKVVP